VVKGINNIFQHLAALVRVTDRSALAIAGDDHEAKKAVSKHLDEIGYDMVDLGPFSEGWRARPTRRHTASCMP
jgi:predicted dinucleotide-binding enzyme